MKIKTAILATVGALVTTTAAHASNLIVNGDFRTGDFTGWTAVAVSYANSISSNHSDGSSTYSAEIAGYRYGPNTLTQVVSDLSGQSYTLGFSVLQLPPNMSAAAGSFDVSWSGVNVFTQAYPNLSGYHDYLVTVLGTGSDTLLFTASNNPGFTYLTNVSLMAPAAVPEPATWAMMLVGLGAVGFTMRRRQNVSVSHA